MRMLRISSPHGEATAAPPHSGIIYRDYIGVSSFKALKQRYGSLKSPDFLTKRGTKDSILYWFHELFSQKIFFLAQSILRVVPLPVTHNRVAEKRIEMAMERR